MAMMSQIPFRDPKASEHNRISNMRREYTRLYEEQCPLNDGEICHIFDEVGVLSSSEETDEAVLEMMHEVTHEFF